MGRQEDIELTSWNRFYTRNLAVAPELIGQAHAFAFDGHTISIALPGSDKLPEYDPDDPFGGGGFDPMDFRPPSLSISSWQRAEDGKTHPLQVNVRDVDVVVSIPGKHTVPKEGQSTPLQKPELLSEQQEQHLNKLVGEYGNVARQAFDLWIRAVRWKADAYRIGLPEVSDFETGWGTYLREKSTQERVYAGAHILTAYAAKTVTTEQWDEVSAALNAGEQPPIFWDLFYDAMGHLERGDLQRTIVDAAVAAETYLRTTVQEGFPAALDESLRAYINEANISQVIRKFFLASLDEQQSRVYRALLSDLHKLFNDRNDIMHSGRKEGLTAPYCRKLIDRVRSLLELAP